MYRIVPKNSFFFPEVPPSPRSPEPSNLQAPKVRKSERSLVIKSQKELRRSLLIRQKTRRRSERRSATMMKKSRKRRRKNVKKRIKRTSPIRKTKRTRRESKPSRKTPVASTTCWLWAIPSLVFPSVWPQNVHAVTTASICR